MLIRDNTMQITSTIWIATAIILANMNMLHNRMWGFLLWMCFAFIIIIIEILRMNSELKMIRRRIRFMEREIIKEEEIKKKVKKQFSLDEITYKTSRNECLLCKTNLDKDIGKGKWHIPLCKKHRLSELDKLTKKALKKK